MDTRLSNLRLAQGWNRKEHSTFARLQAVQVQILALTEHEQRRTGQIPGKTRRDEQPCNRCGRAQPKGQSPKDIRGFIALEPTAVLYTRADGCVRAHDATCDLLPHNPAVMVPDVDPDDIEHHIPDNRALYVNRYGEAPGDTLTLEQRKNAAKAWGWR